MWRDGDQQTKNLREHEQPRKEKALRKWFMKQRLRNLPKSGHMIKTETKKDKYSRFKAIFDESNASGLISLKGDAESTT